MMLVIDIALLFSVGSQCTPFNPAPFSIIIMAKLASFSFILVLLLLVAVRIGTLHKLDSVSRGPSINFFFVTVNFSLQNVHLQPASQSTKIECAFLAFHGKISSGNSFIFLGFHRFVIYAQQNNWFMIYFFFMIIVGVKFPVTAESGSELT